jgi:hypothetical protein
VYVQLQQSPNALGDTTVARVTKVELIDDMTGGTADETVSFGIDGITYDIDLSANNAGILRDIVADYVSHGRKTAGSTAISGRSQRAATSTGPGAYAGYS